MEQKSGPAKVYAQNIVEGAIVLAQNDLASTIDLTFLNPFSDEILVSGAGTEPVEIEVFDALGQRILSASEFYELDRYDVSQWGAGLYYLKVRDNRSNKVYRLIKE